MRGFEGDGDRDHAPAWRRLGDDWVYEMRAAGERVRLGAVVWERTGRRRWFTVSALLSHGPEPAPGLSAGKRTLEALWQGLAPALAQELVSRAPAKSIS